MCRCVRGNSTGNTVVQSVNVCASVVAAQCLCVCVSACICVFVYNSQLRACRCAAVPL